MIPTINSASAALYTHLLIAFVLAIAGFCSLRWLVLRTSGTGRSLLISILCRPLLALPWILFLFYCGYFWPFEVSAEVEETVVLGQKNTVNAVPCLVRLGAEYSRPADYSGHGWALAGTVIPFSDPRTVQLLIVVSTLLSMAQVFGYSLSTLLAFGGIGGIILGLAAKDWLANFLWADVDA